MRVSAHFKRDSGAFNVEKKDTSRSLVVYSKGRVRKVDLFSRVKDTNIVFFSLNKDSGDKDNSSKKRKRHGIFK